MVKDNIEVGTFSTRLLKHPGYETVWALNAQEALTSLEEQEGRFDVVFSDVVMPGMGEAELGQEIRHHTRACPWS